MEREQTSSKCKRSPQKSGVDVEVLVLQRRNSEIVVCSCCVCLANNMCGVGQGLYKITANKYYLFLALVYAVLFKHYR